MLKELLRSRGQLNRSALSDIILYSSNMVVADHHSRSMQLSVYYILKQAKSIFVSVNILVFLSQSIKIVLLV